MAKQRRAAKKSRRAAAPTSSKQSARRALGVAANAQKGVKERVAAMKSAPVTTGDAVTLDSLMAILADSETAIDIRLSALQSLGAARFASPDFAAKRGDYIATLRRVVDDPNAELRQRVLGILAREKDGFTQKRLLEGLKQPAKALVPPQKALQLLGYDVHADAYPIAREIVRHPPNPEAKREALRLLAADAASAPTFESLLRDKSETAEIRQISAAALHALKPESLQTHAREMVLDATDSDDIHQTSLTALTEFGSKTMAADQPLLDRVRQMSGQASPSLQASARRFLKAYSR